MGFKQNNIPVADNATLKTHKPSNKIAVLLNSHARHVNQPLANDIAKIIGRDNLYYSHSIQQAEVFVRDIVNRHYDTIVCGGGDGTLFKTYNLIAKHIREANAWREERAKRFSQTQDVIHMPRFAFLNLGTGNSLRSVVGATDPITNLQRMVNHANNTTVHTIPLIESIDSFFSFGGLGYDSMLLNDYNWFKEHIKVPFRETIAGYAAAAILRTVPTLLSQKFTSSHKPIHAKIITHAEAFYIDAKRGDASIRIKPGAVLYDGPITMIGMGSTPFFGYGLRVFPFASIMPSMFQLRVANMSLYNTLLNFPSIWRGSYRNPESMYDFFAHDIEIVLNQPFPFQHSGDAQGVFDTLRIKLSKHTLKLVDMYNIP